MHNRSVRKRLPVIDVFDPPYEVWSRRPLGNDERLLYYREHNSFVSEVKDYLEKRIDSAYLAAAYMAEVRSDNALENFIDDALDASPAMEAVQTIMPAETPKNLLRYQAYYPSYDADKVDKEIREHGAFFDEGQFLFHGGGWPDGVDEFVTSRPLSTSFCPQIALRNSEFKGKAYDLGRVDLIVVKTTGGKCPAYVYGRSGEMKHEKEVVFPAGVKLKLVSRTLIQQSTVCKIGPDMNPLYALVPYYVVEAEIF